MLGIANMMWYDYCIYEPRHINSSKAHYLGPRVYKCLEFGSFFKKSTESILMEDVMYL